MLNAKGAFASGMRLYVPVSVLNAILQELQGPLELCSRGSELEQVGFRENGWVLDAPDWNWPQQHRCQLDAPLSHDGSRPPRIRIWQRSAAQSPNTKAAGPYPHACAGAKNRLGGYFASSRVGWDPTAHSLRRLGPLSRGSLTLVAPGRGRARGRQKTHHHW